MPTNNDYRVGSLIGLVIKLGTFGSIVGLLMLLGNAKVFGQNVPANQVVTGDNNDLKTEEKVGSGACLATKPITNGNVRTGRPTEAEVNNDDGKLNPQGNAADCSTTTNTNTLTPRQTTTTTVTPTQTSDTKSQIGNLDLKTGPSTSTSGAASTSGVGEIKPNQQTGVGVGVNSNPVNAPINANVPITTTTIDQRDQKKTSIFQQGNTQINGTGTDVYRVNDFCGKEMVFAQISQLIRNVNPGFNFGFVSAGINTSWTQFNDKQRAQMDLIRVSLGQVTQNTATLASNYTLARFAIRSSMLLQLQNEGWKREEAMVEVNNILSAMDKQFMFNPQAWKEFRNENANFQRQLCAPYATIVSNPPAVTPPVTPVPLNLTVVVKQEEQKKVQTTQTVQTTQKRVTQQTKVKKRVYQQRRPNRRVNRRGGCSCIR
jgi:hypothetical protein